ncbi:hypothetical protein AGMMS49983_10420 [Clostridia bacterium]|nr:hypothetical protein AGMMS49983_10420 [Clostridia bacterium]
MIGIISDPNIALSEKNVIKGYVSTSAAADIFYLTRKEFQDISKTYGTLKNIMGLKQKNYVCSGLSCVSLI